MKSNLRLLTLLAIPCLLSSCIPGMKKSSSEEMNSSTQVSQSSSSQSSLEELSSEEQSSSDISIEDSSISESSETESESIDSSESISSEELSSSETVSSDSSSSEVASSSETPSSISSSESSSSDVENKMSFANQVTTVYGAKIVINPTFTGISEDFTASYSGNDIRIDEKEIVGLKAGTTTTVTLTSTSGLKCTFTVIVNGSSYKATSARDAKWASSEGWFNSTSIGEISGMGSDFFNGIDISSTKALYDNGTVFYNANGVQQSLFYILKDAGVNWIRLKLWVDPKSSAGVSYGGGESNLENALWMAKEAKAAGLKFLLDFHYSDYWTHPGQQIIPKSWNDCNSKSALCARIKSYTTETLNVFKSNGCLPDMVQLGNEISSGIYLQKYSGSSDVLDSYGQPGYLTGKSSYSYGTSNHADYYDYIKAASEGVSAVSTSIKKVLHWAKGSSISASTINNFFNNMPSAYYDYAALSLYPYYCFDTMNEAKTLLNGLSLSKPWFIAETSYPFSGSSYVYENETNVTNFSISDWTDSGITSIKSSYAFTMTGQANIIHDLTEAVVAAGGKGVFYWEGTWVPNKNVGWAGQGSACTWSNQGFFSYDGKALANLDVFKQMSPHI